MTIPDVILVAFNPRAGAADRCDLLNSLQIRLKDLGFDVQMVGELSDLEALASEYRENGRLRMVVSAGGDGTLAAVAQRTHPDTCLAVFPLGTENLMAKWCGATVDLEKFSAAVKANRTKLIDAAMANGRLALITIGIGFDAEVVRLVHSKRTGHISKWSYAWPILRTIWNYRFPQFRVTIEDWHESIMGPANSPPTESEATHNADPKRWNAPWVFIANLPLYAGGLSIIPHAKPADGFLDIACFSRAGRIRGLCYALWIALRRHTRSCEYSAFRAKKITIDSPVPSGYQLDGDFGGELPLEIRIQPGRIKLLSFDRQDVSLSH